MSTLRSALDELASEDLGSLGQDELQDRFGEVHRASVVLEAERLRTLAEIERRRAFARDGHLSATSWLAARYKVAFPHAARQVRTALALEGMPATREALGSGELSSSAVASLVSAHDTSPEEFSRAEGMLVQAAQSLPAKELQVAVSDWKDRVDASPGLEEAERLRKRRRLELSPRPSGMVGMDGDLDPETGQTVNTALRAVIDAQARSGTPDPRTPTQRRADALGEVCRQWLDRGDRPTVGGERPHLNVVIGWEALKGPSGRAELDDAGSVPGEVARMLACDASISRVVTRGASEPLDVGRKTPVVPAAVRRAVIVRDRHCRFPGCDRPQGWCDAHHVRHWADGGETALGNLVLLCRPHHRLLHEPSGFRLEMNGNLQPVFRRPDGTVLEDRAPP
jgi:uncharacterized protein DUF222/HNH endonuclease